jgi:hypothetical protein
LFVKKKNISPVLKAVDLYSQIKEVNCTDPSPPARIPWFKRKAIQIHFSQLGVKEKK